METQREKHEKLKNEAMDKKIVYENKLRDSINEIGTTESGIILLKHLHDSCGFGQSNVVRDMTNGKIDSTCTIYNNALEDVYKYLRKFMSVKIRNQVEQY
jgi:hypothetical protein